MSSREKILTAVRSSQPAASALPDIQAFAGQAADAAKFIAVLQGIGARVFQVNSYEEIVTLLEGHQMLQGRTITTLPQLQAIAEPGWETADPHSLHNVQLTILHAQLGVCENGAVWITENEMVQRATPFIADNLAVVLNQSTLVATMHDAYNRLAELPRNYGFGSFIAGPSKTADIEQSLVLGAHGPRTMTVFLVQQAGE